MKNCCCEANKPPGERCSLCMGWQCFNTTFRHNGEVFHLVDATMIWRYSVWDGPISGLAIYRQFPCYAKSYTMSRRRSYWLFPMTHAEWKAEVSNKAHCLTGIGSHTPVDFSVIEKRKPLGFFRLKRCENMLLDSHDEKRFSGVYQEWASESSNHETTEESEFSCCGQSPAEDRNPASCQSEADDNQPVPIIADSAKSMDRD